MSTAFKHRSTRRGAIFGLTMAEVFMLVAFILLFLLAFWQRSSLLGSNKDFDSYMRSFISIIHKNNLQETLISKSPAELVAHIQLLEKNDSQEFVINEVLLKNTIEDEITSLTDLVRDVLEKKSLEEIISLINLSVSTNIQDLIDINEQFGSKSKKEISSLIDLAKDDQGLKGEIRAKLGKYSDDKNRLAHELENRLGDLVRGMSGYIDDYGRISLPNEFLFLAGESALQPQMQKFLFIACEPWLETLRATQVNLSEIRIEGHASREWEGAASVTEAFINNLELSQRRAQTVLTECLSVTTNSELKTWAQKYLTAIGYSSSRPVMSEGIDLPEMSRRVVLGVQLDAEKALQDIDLSVRK